MSPRSMEPRCQNIHLPDAEVALYPALFERAVADRLFEQLRRRIAWRQESVHLFGRDVPQPRLIAWHGDPGRAYTYSGLTLTPEPWTDELHEVLARIRDVQPDARFNSVLLNLYRDGNDSVGWHSDDEPSLGTEPKIASVSLGAVRTFHLQHRRRRDVARVDLDLPHGSMLWMAGPTQHHYKHRLPKRAGVAAPRINLTFRRIEDAG